MSLYPNRSAGSSRRTPWRAAGSPPSCFRNLPRSCFGITSRPRHAVRSPRAGRDPERRGRAASRSLRAGTFRSCARRHARTQALLPTRPNVAHVVAVRAVPGGQIGVLAQRRVHHRIPRQHLFECEVAFHERQPGLMTQQLRDSDRVLAGLRLRTRASTARRCAARIEHRPARSAGSRTPTMHASFVDEYTSTTAVRFPRPAGGRRRQLRPRGRPRGRRRHRRTPPRPLRRRVSQSSSHVTHREPGRTGASTQPSG